MSDPHLSKAVIRIFTTFFEYPGPSHHAVAYTMQMGGHGLFYFNLELIEDVELREDIISHFNHKNEPFRVFAYMNLDAERSYQEELMLNLFERAPKGEWDD